jgi:hypothetical protein
VRVIDTGLSGPLKYQRLPHRHLARLAMNTMPMRDAEPRLQQTETAAHSVFPQEHAPIRQRVIAKLGTQRDTAAQHVANEKYQ